MNATTKTADDVARELGFDPAVRFVTFRRNRVGFTAGKPDEVGELAYRAIRAGYRITRELANAANFAAARMEAIRRSRESDALA